MLASTCANPHIQGMDQGRFNIPHVASAMAAWNRAESSDFDLNPEVRGLLPAGRVLRPASVLVPLVERGAGVNVILTRRSEALKHHPGQIAFPGGKVDETDATPQAAALREAEEEIGLPRETVNMIGAMPEHETVTRFRITPFVGVVSAQFRPIPELGEVEEVFEVPLAFLMDPANLQVHSRIWQGRQRSYYAIPYGPYYVWGATARMLKSLSDRLLQV